MARHERRTLVGGCFTSSMPQLLDLLTPTRAEFERIFARSAHWASEPNRPEAQKHTARPRIATIFAGPAFRTRLAFDTAIDSISAHRVDLPVVIGEREPISDTAAILSSGVDAVVIRHSDDEQLRELAAAATIPVVNAMTSLGHPCEVISEAFTIWQRRGTLDGLAFTFAGEDNNLFRSWCELATHFDIRVTQLAPDAFGAHGGWLAEMRERGASVTVTNDASAAFTGADVIYTDGWPSEALQLGGIRTAFLAQQVTTASLDLMSPTGVLMHCMPVARGNEVSAEAFADPRSITLAAKRNLAPTHAAILEYALGRI